MAITPTVGRAQITARHRDSLSEFPLGQGWHIQYNEINFRDSGDSIVKTHANAIFQQAYRKLPPPNSRGARP